MTKARKKKQTTRAPVINLEAIGVGVLIALLSWGGAQILEVKTVQARLLEMQLVDQTVNREVSELAPHVHKLDTKVDGVLCMLRHHPDDAEARLECLQGLLEE